MNRSTPVLPLRGSDQALLEVQLPELLRRPLGQIALLNVMDLLELAGTDGRPKSLDRALQGFAGGMGRQLADVPRGRSWEMLLDDLGEVPAERVPAPFRALLRAEAESRPETARRTTELFARWEAVAPAPFELNARKARIQRAEAVEPKEPDKRPPPSDRPPREERPPKEAAPKAAPKPKPVMDVERNDFVVQQCLERLGRSSEKGLLEAVLVAGIRHAGKERYPDLTAVEIVGVLRGLKDRNRVRSSANRWMAR